MTNSIRIPAAVARKLGHYVYVYVNPLDETVFYVGKGKGSRALAHLKARPEKEVARIIRGIRAEGAEPRIEILAHGLPSEDVAFKVEAAAIDLMGIEYLTNAVRGHGSREYGRMPVDELVAHYTQREVKIREPSILIRINKAYRYGMTPVELYDATRSSWKVGTRADGAAYAFAVFQSVIREVYQITGWHEGGTTFNSRYDGRPPSRADRWEFVGVLADEVLRKRYVNRSVARYFQRGMANPIAYVKC